MTRLGLRMLLGSSGGGDLLGACGCGRGLGGFALITFGPLGSLRRLDGIADGLLGGGDFGGSGHVRRLATATHRLRA